VGVGGFDFPASFRKKKTHTHMRKYPLTLNVLLLLLFLQGYAREWIDVRGRPKYTFGRIEECEQDYFDRDCSYFTVKYDVLSRNDLLGTGETSIPGTDTAVPEKAAWGGCLLYDSKCSEINQIPRSLSNASAPFHFHWVLPSSRTETRVVSEDPAGPVRSFSMIVRGVRLEIQAKKSLIPNSGLGVFVKASVRNSAVLATTPVDYFELKPGELVDLGVYAPLRPEDRTNDDICLFKNFMHNWEVESWSFEQAAHHKGKNCDVFDITDDWSGDLHSLARENVLVYVNETDGRPNSVATILAEHDPAGGVHYLMGHHEEHHGAFRIPLNGEEIELKIDYGNKYEKVRLE
jgi:hypothetical protein